jgi:hypothetical protein
VFATLPVQGEQDDADDITIKHEDNEELSTMDLDIVESDSNIDALLQEPDLSNLDDFLTIPPSPPPLLPPPSLPLLLPPPSLPPMLPPPLTLPLPPLPPLHSQDVFCHLTFVPGDQNFTAYRMRDGDKKYIANFLHRSIGPDRAFEEGDDPDFWRKLSGMTYDPHLVEVMKYTVSPIGTAFVVDDDVTVRYCALPNQPGGKGGRHDRLGLVLGPDATTTTPYHIVPFLGSRNGFAVDPPTGSLALESRWMVTCKLCDKRYEISVYR